LGWFDLGIFISRGGKVGSKSEHLIAALLVVKKPGEKV
jgi:hypothetical protein